MFLKDEPVVLALAITKLCDLSMKRSKFPLECQFAKLRPLYKKSQKQIQKTIVPFRFCYLFQKL